MSETRTKRPVERKPTHPGELMREILDDHVKLPIAEAARRMKISRPALYAVLNGTGAVTADMALRFGKLVGAPPELYVRMQANYDLWRARQRLKDTLAGIPPAA
ncbi:MAG TPA: HigA family addiction module antitoxin [Alphaproteobacteria bacterium]|nr:HigA family addiction module antitoxin [Alphaproteobacteria bacterium]